MSDIILASIFNEFVFDKIKGKDILFLISINIREILTIGLNNGVYFWCNSFFHIIYCSHQTHCLPHLIPECIAKCETTAVAIRSILLKLRSMMEISTSILKSRKHSKMFLSPEFEVLILPLFFKAFFKGDQTLEFHIPTAGYLGTESILHPGLGSWEICLTCAFKDIAYSIVNP